MDMSPQLVAYVSTMAKFTEYDAVRNGFTTPDPSTPRKPARVLVLDANADNRQALVDQFKQLNLEPLPAAHSLAALNAITCRQLDMILISGEPGVPVFDGALRPEVIRYARRERIPLFVLSTVVDNQLWQQYLANEIESELAAPIRGPALKTLQLSLHLPLSAGDDPLAPPFETIPQWCKDYLEKDIRGLEVAVSKYNKRLMIHFAHRLNGATHVMNLHEAAKLADQLEQLVRRRILIKPQAVHMLITAMREAITRYFKTKEAE